MSTPILATKLYLPPPRIQLVHRPRLVERLHAGLGGKLTLISAPAGFGKTTLVSEWIAGCTWPVAWLSLDEGDRDPLRFLTYVVAALQTIAPGMGEGVLNLLQSPQPPSIEWILTSLLNEIAAIPKSPAASANARFILVLDDYHLIDAPQVDDALTFLLEHLPPQMHLVITTREDPNLALPKLRVRGQLTEVRAAELRFSVDEAADFLNRVMGLPLSSAEMAALATRTEGWIAGLQLAALSMQRQQDTQNFIESFTGSHRFVMDYLVEEVLHQQPEAIQRFLLHTSILDRFCGPLCEAVLRAPLENELLSGQATLDYLEQANLFIVPLDNERRWYRYHHLFAELLRQRLLQQLASASGSARGSARGSASAAGAGISVALLHIRASIWYEEQDLDLEAFQHAAAAHDIERAARLVEGKGMPLIFRGAAAPVLQWLASLPKAELDARAVLWVIYASALLFVSQLSDVEAKLQAAEAALASTTIASAQDDAANAKQRDLIGHIASIRATLGVFHYDVETIVAQSLRALAHLHPDNLPVRTATTWTLGIAYQIKGERAAAAQAYNEAIATSQTIGHFIIQIMATIGLGNIQEAENQLHLAHASYLRVLELAGNPPQPVACEAHLGLARIYYEWNDLAAAQQHVEQGAHLAQQLDNSDRTVTSALLLAQIKLAQGEGEIAMLILARAAQAVEEHNFLLLRPALATAQVRTLLQQQQLEAAAALAQTHELPLSQARVYLAQGNPAAALTVLAPLYETVIAKRWPDETRKILVLQALAHHALGEATQAQQRLQEALTLTAPGGFIRAFVDEGLPMAQLLRSAAAHGIMAEYTARLLDTFGAEVSGAKEAHRPPTPSPQPTSDALPEALSERELEVLVLIAAGKQNQEIADELIISLNTVRYHTKNLYGKLAVNKRTQAVAKAQKLGLI